MKRMLSASYEAILLIMKLIGTVTLNSIFSYFIGLEE